MKYAIVDASIRFSPAEPFPDADKIIVNDIPYCTDNFCSIASMFGESQKITIDQIDTVINNILTAPGIESHNDTMTIYVIISLKHDISFLDKLKSLGIRHDAELTGHNVEIIIRYIGPISTARLSKRQTQDVLNLTCEQVEALERAKFAEYYISGRISPHADNILFDLKHNKNIPTFVISAMLDIPFSTVRDHSDHIEQENDGDASLRSATGTPQQEIHISHVPQKRDFELDPRFPNNYDTEGIVPPAHFPFTGDVLEDVRALLHVNEINEKDSNILLECLFISDVFEEDFLLNLALKGYSLPKKVMRLRPVFFFYKGLKEHNRFCAPRKDKSEELPGKKETGGSNSADSSDNENHDSDTSAAEETGTQKSPSSPSERTDTDK